MPNEVNSARDSPAELVLRAPTGFEFIDDGSGRPKYGRPEYGQWIFAYGPELCGKMKACRADNLALLGLFPLLKKRKEFVPFNLSYDPTPIVVEEIYGSAVEIPEGWKFEAFRKVRRGEDFLLRGSHGVCKAGYHEIGEMEGEPRIIVKKDEDA